MSGMLYHHPTLCQCPSCLPRVVYVSPRSPATIAYAEAKRRMSVQLQALILEIQEHVDGDVTYSHVGDMNEVEERLRRIVDFLQGV